MGERRKTQGGGEEGGDVGEEEKKGGEDALKSSKALSKYKTLGCGLEEFNVVKMTILP